MCLYFLLGCILQDEWGPLHIAAKHGHVAVVETLIELGTNVNAHSTVSYHFVS